MSLSGDVAHFYTNRCHTRYWIVDYLAVGATRYIGSPKTPTISIYTLENGEYQLQQFRGSDHIVSMTFPKLTLTAEAIFQAAGI